MKKSIIAMALGMAGSVAIVTSSQGQGLVYFGNYAIGGSGLISAPITISGSGLACGPSFTAELLYGGATGASYATTGVTSSFLGGFDGDAGNGAGLIASSTSDTVSISSYPNSVNGGAAWFEIEVYNGSSYANATIRGISAPIELALLATAANSLPTGSLLSDNGAATIPLTAFTVSPVAPVPEPTTLALAGLGGFGMLMALRRKQA